jgi:hypothetical protein
MPKSKHRKSHQKKLNIYKTNKKREQEVLKKEMIDKYTKMQKENLENQQAHSSIEEVSGPEINIDDLGQVDDLSGIVEDVDIESIEFLDGLPK